ncbi:uncharacterized protein N7484_008475 [Penicillium longicatenatum]|uniref:uncharacterized protein n=1 Tax=Penicillium longicatenatum TaxID=1561947 RepID=UPI002548B1AD|nr:uncharacterized protein N7484_008475 [Penicillium longicatenatum]KAJ5635162.1 hypothetical protein N7484_008475 [Penicillium longicatenatum]
MVDFDKVGTTVTSPVKLAHVVLRTKPENFVQMTSFYKTFLGGHASHENDFLSFITYDDEHHRIAIAAIPGLGDHDARTCGLEHIAFTFAKLEDLLLAYRQRQAQGIKPVWAVNHGITISIYYRDPDGNQIETQVDGFNTVEEANEYMKKKEFSENPIGVDFDPDEYIQKLKDGASPNELLVRPDIGPRGLDTVPIMQI